MDRLGRLRFARGRLSARMAATRIRDPAQSGRMLGDASIAPLARTGDSFATNAIVRSPPWPPGAQVRSFRKARAEASRPMTVAYPNSTSPPAHAGRRAPCVVAARPS